MADIYAVVGEHWEDPNRLLLLGDDGLDHDFALLDGTTAPVEPDEAWDADAALLPLEEVAG